MFVHGPSQNMDLQRFMSYFVVRGRFAAIDWIVGYSFMIFGVLTLLSEIFQQYHGDQF
jgi:hypothetical protein